MYFLYLKPAASYKQDRREIPISIKERLMLASDTFWAGVKASWHANMAGSDRAQSTNLVGLFIGLMIAAIVAVQVFIPVVLDAIASLDENNTSSTTITVLDLLPLFAALLLLIALASPLMRRI